MKPEQDYIVLGGLKSPGLATVTTGEFVRKYDVREPMGASGGSTVYHGEKIKTADVRIDLWTTAHFLEWKVFSKVLFAKPTLVAMSVDHPVLALIEFTKCQVESVSAFIQDDDGMWSCTIKLLEFKRPTAAYAKPLAATPNVKNPTPTAPTAAEQQMQTLHAQLDEQARRTAALLGR